MDKQAIIAEIQRVARENCRKAGGYEDILALCADRVPQSANAAPAGKEKIATGHVYLTKSGPHYKIGRTNSLGQ